MDSQLRQQELQSCDILAPIIQTLLPTALVRNMSAAVMVLHQNGSISNVFPLPDGKCDFTSDTDVAKIERHDLTDDECLNLLKQIDDLGPQNESTTTGAVAPIQGSSSNSGYEAANQWWKKGNHFPNGSPSASLNLNEGTKEVRRLYHPDLVNFVCDLLPFKRDLMRVDGDGTIQVELGQGRVEIIPSESANKFRVRTFVDTEMMNDTDHVSREGLLQFASDLVEKFNRLGQEFSAPEEETDDDESDTYIQAMKDYAEANGQSTDPLKNRDVLNLAALGTVQAQADDAPLQTNPPAPFSNTMKGKALKYVLGEGAIFVDKKDVPKQKFLTNTANGVQWATGAENVNYRRPKWRGWGKTQ